MAALGYLAKLKRGLRPAFGAQFLHKNALYLIIYQCTKFQSYTLLFSQDIKQNVLLSSYSDS